MTPESNVVPLFPAAAAEPSPRAWDAIGPAADAGSARGGLPGGRQFREAVLAEARPVRRNGPVGRPADAS